MRILHEQIAKTGHRVAVVQADDRWSAPYLAVLRKDGSEDLRASNGFYRGELDAAGTFKDDPITRAIAACGAYCDRLATRQGL